MDPVIEAKSKCEGVVNHLRSELEGLRIGRARPNLVEPILVEYYGTKLPIRDLATVSCPESNLILIQPWDENATKAIEKSLNTAPLDAHPVVDGNVLRVVLPPMTEERRQELRKLLKEKLERTRVAIRLVREEIWKNLREAERAGELSEDEQFKHQKALQNVIDEYQERLDEIAEAKERELMTV